MIAARYDAVSRVWFLQDSMEEWWSTMNEEDFYKTLQNVHRLTIWNYELDSRGVALGPKLQDINKKLSEFVEKKRFDIPLEIIFPKRNSA